MNKTYYASYGGKHYAIKGFVGKAFREVTLWDKAIKKNSGKLFLSITLALLIGTIFSVIASTSGALEAAPNVLIVQATGKIADIYKYGFDSLANFNFSMFKLASASSSSGGWEPLSKAITSIKSLIISMSRYEDVLQGFGLGVAALYFLMHLLPKLATEQVTIQSFTKEFIKLGVTVFLIFEMGTMTRTVGQMFDALGGQMTSYSRGDLTSQYISQYGAPSSQSGVEAMNNWISINSSGDDGGDTTTTLRAINRIFDGYQGSVTWNNNPNDTPKLFDYKADISFYQAIFCLVAVLFNAILTVGLMFYFIITVYSTVITRLFEFHIRSIFAPVGIASFVEDGLRSPGGRYFKKLLGVGIVGIIYYLIAKICTGVISNSFSSIFNDANPSYLACKDTFTRVVPQEQLFPDENAPWTLMTTVLLEATLVTALTCIAGTTIFKQAKQLGDEIMGG